MYNRPIVRFGNDKPQSNVLKRNVTSLASETGKSAISKFGLIELLTGKSPICIRNVLYRKQNTIFYNGNPPATTWQ